MKKKTTESIDPTKLKNWLKKQLKENEVSMRELYAEFGLCPGVNCREGIASAYRILLAQVTKGKFT